MALIIEDGTGLADAQAYADVPTVIAYAALRGVTIPDVEATVEAQIIVATDYLESLEYILERATTTQALSWPRCLHLWNGMLGFNYWGTDLTQPMFPIAQLQAATAQLVIEQQNGTVLQPTTQGGDQFVIEERVDVIMTRYSEKLGTLDTPTMRIVNSILRKLVVVGSTGVTLRTVRM